MNLDHVFSAILNKQEECQALQRWSLAISSKFVVRLLAGAMGAFLYKNHKAPKTSEGLFYTAGLLAFNLCLGHDRSSAVRPPPQQFDAGTPWPSGCSDWPWHIANHGYRGLNCRSLLTVGEGGGGDWGCQLWRIKF